MKFSVQNFMLLPSICSGGRAVEVFHSPVKVSGIAVANFLFIPLDVILYCTCPSAFAGDVPNPLMQCQWLVFLSLIIYEVTNT